MGLDIELAEREIKLLAEAFENGMREGKEGRYDDAVYSLNMALISAGRMMNRDPAVGRELKLDKVMLVIKGFQLKAYQEKLIHGQGERKEIFQKMRDIARGEVDEQKNPYAKKIFDAMDKLENGLDKLLSA